MPRWDNVRQAETLRLRQRVVDRWNGGNVKGQMMTYAQIAAELGLTRGAVGRLLTEARALGWKVRPRMSSSEVSRRQSISARKNIGEDAYLARMKAMRAARTY